MPPELVGMDLPVPTDAADPPARVVPLVHLQELKDLGGPVGVLPQEPEVEVGAVGMVVHREDLRGHPPLVDVPGPIHDQVHGPSGLLVAQVLVDQSRAPAGVNQMVETDPGDRHLFHQRENLGDFFDIGSVDGEPKADLDSGRLTIPDALQSPVEGAGDPPEPVVDGFHSVQADAHIG